MPTDTGYQQLCRQPGFQSFLWTQFLGALNDNIYKIAVSIRAIHVAATTAGGQYLALAGAIFVLPFALFSGYAGRLADIHSKRTVLISVKAFEIAVMLFGFAAFFSDSIHLSLIVLFLMALHSTIFSPAKYGILPEIIPDRQLSRANGLLEMSTFVAIVLGTSLGSVLLSLWHDQPSQLGLLLVAIAVIGFVTSLRIPRVPPSGAQGKFSVNPFAEIVTGTRQLLHDRPLALTVAGISYFWFLGALFQMDLLLFGKEILRVSDLHVGLLVTSLAIGIGAGSLLAGKWSGDKIELGLVPLGSLLTALCCFALYAARSNYLASVVTLALLGASSGLFIVPLNAFLQQQGGATQKGRLIATNNFYNTIGILLASATLWLLHDRLHLSAATLVAIFGAVTLLGTIYIVRLMPAFLVRSVLWILTHTFYKIRVRNPLNVPAQGPALLVANHLSHVDGLLIGASISRQVRFMVWRPFYESKALGWFFRLMHAIPVGGPSSASLRQAREQLQQGHVVCIFAEGAISRTGNLLPFKRGMEKIAEGLDVPIIPVHLDGVWGSIFSFERGRFFHKWPRRIPYPVTVSFADPMPSTATAWQVRQVIQELASESGLTRDTLPQRFIRTARSNWSRQAIADSTGRQLTYGRALTAAVVIKSWIRRHSAPGEMIGVLLPASAAGAIANIGISMAGRVPVNLNFTTGPEAMTSAIRQCGIGMIVTSKKMPQVPAGAVYIEDILQQNSVAKLRALLTARLLPANLLGAPAQPDSPATVIFSSGSTGDPKGVLLTHRNILSNIESITQVFPLTSEDRIVGSLPFFHSFGFTVTIWLPLIHGCGVLYHPNPLDARGIGQLVQKYRGTFLLSTPTFCANYIRKCKPEEFASLRYVLVGAEKLQNHIRDAFRQTFHLELFEGYGCTEMSPVISVNTPDREGQTGNKPGTVGQPLPGVAIKIVDPETHEPKPPETEGLLLVKGPNQMRGYLGRPALTAESHLNGWYNTGDIASIDEEGFLTITGRISRFSKIGGEMVPHEKVEEAINLLLGEAEAIVISVPDDRKGERLIVLHTSNLEPHELTKVNLPKLWIPKPEDIHYIPEIPKLQTGKTDLRKARLLWGGLFSPQAGPAPTRDRKGAVSPPPASIPPAIPQAGPAPSRDRKGAVSPPPASIPPAIPQAGPAPSRDRKGAVSPPPAAIPPAIPQAGPAPSRDRKGAVSPRPATLPPAIPQGANHAH